METVNSIEGSLIQLVGTGQFNTELKLNNVVCEYQLFEAAATEKIIICHTGDLMKFDYLVLTFSVNPTLDMELEILLKMSIGGEDVLQFPLSLLTSLKEAVNIDGNKWYIDLQPDMFLGTLPYCTMMSRNVVFTLSVGDNFLDIVTHYGIGVTSKLIDREERIRLMSEPSSKHLIQQLSVMHLVNKACNNILFTELPFQSISKGFFLEATDLTKHLSEIVVYFNFKKRFHLNEYLIQNKCKKISADVLYFPFNAEKDYASRTTESFEGSPNLDRIDSIQLKLVFKSQCGLMPIRDVHIYSLQANMLMRSEGETGLLHYNKLLNCTKQCNSSIIPLKMLE